MTTREELLRLVDSLVEAPPTKEGELVKIGADKSGSRWRNRELILEEYRELLDTQARRYLGLWGEEFIKKWESGFWDDNPDGPEIMHVSLLIPFVRYGRLDF